MRGRPIIVVCAFDQLLIKDAFAKSCVQADLRFTLDGTELIEYLQDSAEKCPRPDIILIDLSVPEIGGLKALKWIKFHLAYRGIPAVIYTASRNENEIQQCFEVGANTLLTTCVRFENLVVTVKKFVQHLTDVCLTT
jgi:CheY-like chemotaxis protein